MTQSMGSLFPPVADAEVPYRSDVLRGCSQLYFQPNELTASFRHDPGARIPSHQLDSTRVFYFSIELDISGPSLRK